MTKRIFDVVCTTNKSGKGGRRDQLRLFDPNAQHTRCASTREEWGDGQAPGGERRGVLGFWLMKIEEWLAAGVMAYRNGAKGAGTVRGR